MRAILMPLLLALVTTPAPAQERPRIGLVLSGGGARGAAHVGVLQVLEELRVPVDCIAATSMGAIVGGSYAAGMGVKDMQRLVLEMDWGGLFQDDPPRADLPVARQQQQDRYFDLELGLRDGELLTPRGAISGQRLELELRRIVRELGNAPVEELPIPFRAVATDLTDGSMVVLDEGSLAQAMRASMAVPGLVAPAQQEDRLLVDGGLVRNLPVDVVRGLCADVVIAVNLGTPLLDREALDTAVGVTLQMITILTEQNVQAQLAALGQDDILISPILGDITAADFHRGLEAIEAGRRAALDQAGALDRLTLTPAAYRAWQADRRQTPSPPPLVERLVIESPGRINPAVVEEALRVEPGVPLDEDALQEDLIRLYGRGDFERLDYRLQTRDGERILAIQPMEKSWGPGYLRFGLGLSTDFQGTQAFALQAGYDRTWVNTLGGAWHNDIKIGRASLIRSAFQQPLTPVGRWFLEPWLSLTRYPVDVYQDDDLVAQYGVERWNLGLDLGWRPGGGSEFRLGLLTGRALAEVEVGTLDLPEPDLREGAVTARLLYDRLDDPFFPRSGTSLSFNAYHSATGLGADRDYTRLEGRWLAAAGRGRDAWHGLVWLGSGLEEDLPVFDQFSLGGFLRLSGFRTDRLLGSNAGLGRVAYYRRMDTLPATAGGAVYLGGSLEAGRVWEGEFEPDADDWRYSASLFLGAQTFLGPLYFGYGRAVEGDDTLYLYIGQP